MDTTETKDQEKLDAQTTKGKKAIAQKADVIKDQEKFVKEGVDYLKETVDYLKEFNAKTTKDKIKPLKESIDYLNNLAEKGSVLLDRAEELSKIAETTTNQEEQLVSQDLPANILNQIASQNATIIDNTTIVKEEASVIKEIVDYLNGFTQKGSLLLDRVEKLNKNALTTKTSK